MLYNLYIMYSGSQTVVGRGLVFNNEPCRTLPSGVANAVLFIHSQILPTN